MNVEKQRLNTFRDWPGNAVVDSRQIAKAGFYFTGPGLGVTCFCCGCRITDLNNEEQVMMKHRAISPNCAFIRDPLSSGNVPLMVNRNISAPELQISRIPLRDRLNSVRWESQISVYKSESARLESFSDWPVPFIVSPEALAETGFFFLHQRDKVQCAFCSGRIFHWVQGDIPEAEHKKHFPACPFLMGLPVGNIPISHSQPSVSTRLCTIENNFEELGIKSYKGPSHPKLCSVESRLKTFTNWPSYLNQRPHELAQAGFFYVGDEGQDPMKDQVVCFHCNGGLKHWEPEDEPWAEHARWFPNCPFLLLLKGQEFVNEIQRLKNSTSQQFLSLEHGANNPDIKPSGLLGTVSVSMPSLSDCPVKEESKTMSRTLSAAENLTKEEDKNQTFKIGLCKICMNAEVGAVLLPCGHLIACVDCAIKLRDCPVCRQHIKATIRTYLS